MGNTRSISRRPTSSRRLAPSQIPLSCQKSPGLPHPLGVQNFRNSGIPEFRNSSKVRALGNPVASPQSFHFFPYVVRSGRFSRGFRNSGISEFLNFSEVRILSAVSVSPQSCHGLGDVTRYCRICGEFRNSAISEFRNFSEVLIATELVVYYGTCQILPFPVGFRAVFPNVPETPKFRNS